VTVTVTFAIGGMIAFCQADDPLAPTAAAGRRSAEESTEASNSFVTEDSPRVSTAAPAEQPSPRLPVRRWGDPEPEPGPPESPVAAELAEIRARVGSAVPQDWQVFGVAAAGEEVAFESSVQALEAEEALAPAPAGEGGSPVPPALAGSEFGGGQGIPFKPSPFPPFPGDWELGPPPGPFLPPNAEALPFESPEALRELTKLLSASARDLERMAHVREEQRRYQDADRLRRLAMQLRRENRRLLPEPTPNPAYPGPSVGRRQTLAPAAP
jgi:hypothetical protein